MFHLFTCCLVSWCNPTSFNWFRALVTQPEAFSPTGDSGLMQPDVSELLLYNINKKIINKTKPPTHGPGCSLLPSTSFWLKFHREEGQGPAAGYGGGLSIRQGSTAAGHMTHGLVPETHGARGQISSHHRASCDYLLLRAFSHCPPRGVWTRHRKKRH